MITPKIAEALNSPGVTYWLKRALMECLNRDPVDALRDAESLVELLRENLDHVGDAPVLPGVERQQRAAAQPLGHVFGEFTAPMLTCHDCRTQVSALWTKPCPNCGAPRERIWL